MDVGCFIELTTKPGCSMTSCSTGNAGLKPPPPTGVGLHWYHPHKHGAAALQTFTASGLIVVEGGSAGALPDVGLQLGALGVRGREGRTAARVSPDAASAIRPGSHGFGPSCTGHPPQLV